MTRLLLLAIGCLLLPCCGLSAPRGTEADVIQNVFGTADNLDLVRTAKKVTTCRLKLKKEYEPTDEGTEKSYDGDPGCFTEGTSIDVSSQQAARLQGVLAHPRTYYFGIAKSCMPRYGVRIRFETDAKELDVNLCFECNILAVRQDGKVIGGEDFDFGESELLALVKELFPNDSEIQALKPH